MPPANVKSKVLLMGPGESGKTSMRSMIFANYLARDTQRLMLTMEMEMSNVTFLGNLILNLWDCGGQKSFIDTYLKKQRDFVFGNVGVLVYVFDIQALSKDSSEVQATEWNKTAVMEYFRSCVDALRQFSPSAHLYCLLHKVDLIEESMRQEVFSKRKQEIEQFIPNDLHVTFFSTSIWESSLFQAWSHIVNSLIPRVSVMNNHLAAVLKCSNVLEVALFERATFLCICKASSLGNDDSSRQQAVSNIVKQFKLSCLKQEGSSTFSSLTIESKSFSAVLRRFTENTLMLIVAKGSDTPVPLLNLTFEVAQRRFEHLLADFPEMAEYL